MQKLISIIIFIRNMSKKGSQNNKVSKRDKTVITNMRLMHITVYKTEKRRLPRL